MSHSMIEISRNKNNRNQQGVGGIPSNHLSNLFIELRMMYVGIHYCDLVSYISVAPFAQHSIFIVPLSE